MSPAPSIGRIVIFRSRTGKYDVPAIITATAATLNPEGVAAYAASGGTKGVPNITHLTNVHLTVFTPGLPGQRGNAEDFLEPPATGIIGENVAGCYQEFDVPQDELPPPDKIVAGERSEPRPGTWRWPTRV